MKAKSYPPLRRITLWLRGGSNPEELSYHYHVGGLSISLDDDLRMNSFFNERFAHLHKLSCQQHNTSGAISNLK